MNISEALQKGSAQLKVQNIHSSRLDAEILLANVCDVDRTRLIINSQNELSADQVKKFFSLIRKREKFEPIAYLVKKKEFYDLEFLVNKNVLIPRPETEHLVDLALYYLEQDASMLDICTGSGAIAVAVKYNRPDVNVFAGDLSSAALNVAKKNAITHCGSRAIKFKQSDLFTEFTGKRFNVITANPPYVDPAKKSFLQKDLTFEPEIALYAENSGTFLVEKIIKSVQEYLLPGGCLLMEIGEEQADFIKQTALATGFTVSIINDYAGLPRLAVLK